MKKKYGVGLGMLALGLAVVGVPSSRAQRRTESNGAGGVILASATSSETVAPASSASSPADLDRRIELLEEELVSLRTEMAARKEAEATAAIAPVPAATPQDSGKPTIASLLGPTSVSGFVDGYYQVNFNHPTGGFGSAGGGVSFRAFDTRDRTISLNMAELILDKAPSSDSAIGRTGYHVALGYGDGMDTYSTSDPGGVTHRLLKEAYVSYMAPLGNGLQIDFGKFVTPMGAEVVESKDNWNYSRGMLFAWAIPYYHFGVRAKYVFNDKAALTGYLVNGWNNVVDNNSGKTYGFSLALTPTKKLTIIPTLLAGPEQPAQNYGPTVAGGIVNVNDTWRQTWDFVVSYAATSKLSFTANADYGRGDRFVTNFTPTPWTLSPPVWWAGFAGYVKYAPNDSNYVALRYEYFEDHDGFMTGEPPRQHFNTFTATYQHTFASYLLSRIEYRRDMSHFPTYSISTFNPSIRNQDTLAIALILAFDSRNAK